MFKKILIAACLFFTCSLIIQGTQAVSQESPGDTLATERSISLEEYTQRMQAGWIGQMAGVGWGAPTEFAFSGVIIPEDRVPEWDPEMINVFNQDDLYVEMTFLQTLLDYGIEVSIKQAGIDFANSAYLLWVANRTGRENLRKGIAPPNSGHPHYNPNADAIDYQIEADFSGLIAPGLPNTAVELGETFGRLMNYGDGLYGGQFVGAMYAEAFFETDPRKIVEAGLQYIPAGSQYAEAVRDVIRWYDQYPDDWERSWELINEKYHKDPAYRQFTSSMGDGEQNIDAKLNGAYIVMGLLYGEGDPDKTIVISMRCGQDSDCNPSNAAGILFTSMGLDAIPRHFVSELDAEQKFSFTEFTFPELLKACEGLAVQYVEKAGGRLEKDSRGNDVLHIPLQDPRPGILVQSWDPGELEDVSFTKEELAQIKGSPVFKWSLVGLMILLVALSFIWQPKRTAYLLLPFLLVFILLEMAAGAIPPDLLGTANIIAMFQVLCTIIAVLMLFAPDKRFSWFRLVISLIVVVLIVSFIGSVGSTEGRWLAATKITFYGALLFGYIWSLAWLLTLLLIRRKYTRARFHLLYLASLYVSHIVGIYLVILAMGSVNGPWADLAGNPVVLLGGALVLTILVYLISLPYLVLVRYEPMFNKRFRILVDPSKTGK